MILKEKNKNPIGRFYIGLSRKEKGKFLLWVCLLTSFSQSTVISRLRDNGWRPLERRSIEEGIASEQWKEVL